MKVKEESKKVGLKLNIQKTKIMAYGPITSWQIDGETVETVSDFIFLGSKTPEDGDCSHEIKRCLLLGRKVMTNLDSTLKSRDIILSTKVRLVKAMVFPVVRYECDNWTIKRAEQRRIDAFELWCWRRLFFFFLFVVGFVIHWNETAMGLHVFPIPIPPPTSLSTLEKTLESPLDCQKIQPAHPKGNQSWIFIGRTDAEAETPILWPPDANSWLIWRDPDGGKDWRQGEKGTTEDKMVGWHH